MADTLSDRRIKQPMAAVLLLTAMLLLMLVAGRHASAQEAHDPPMSPNHKADTNRPHSLAHWSHLEHQQEHELKLASSSHVARAARLHSELQDVRSKLASLRQGLNGRLAGLLDDIAGAEAVVTAAIGSGHAQPVPARVSSRRVALLVVGKAMQPNRRRYDTWERNVVLPLLRQAPLTMFLVRIRGSNSLSKPRADPTCSESTSAASTSQCGHPDPALSKSSCAAWKNLSVVPECVATLPRARVGPGVGERARADFSDQFSRMDGCFAAVQRHERTHSIAFTHLIKARPLPHRYQPLLYVHTTSSRRGRFSPSLHSVTSRSRRVITLRYTSSRRGRSWSSARRSRPSRNSTRSASRCVRGPSSTASLHRRQAAVSARASSVTPNSSVRGKRGRA